MSQYVSTPTKGYMADEAIPQYARVKLGTDATHLALAGDEQDIGTAVQAAHAAEDQVSARLRSAQGTHKAIAAGAVALGAGLFAAAAGKVDDSGTNDIGAVAMEAAAADGDIIEIMFV